MPLLICFWFTFWIIWNKYGISRRNRGPEFLTRDLKYSAWPILISRFSAFDHFFHRDIDAENSNIQPFRRMYLRQVLYFSISDIYGLAKVPAPLTKVAISFYFVMIFRFYRSQMIHEIMLYFRKCIPVLNKEHNLCSKHFCESIFLKKSDRIFMPQSLYQ